MINDIKAYKNWQASVQRRKALIDRAGELGLLLKDPYNMKIRDIADAVEKAERWTRSC